MANHGVSLEEKLEADPQREAEVGGLAGQLGMGFATSGGGGDALMSSGMLSGAMGIQPEMSGTPHNAAANNNLEALQALASEAGDQDGEGDPAALSKLLNGRDEA